tara:strand:- start:409 stop:555 length:147 start_codon:yes stop_codon:yes gene_type:complete
VLFKWAGGKSWLTKNKPEIKNEDFHISIKKAKENDLIFVDPPYVTKFN